MQSQALFAAYLQIGGFFFTFVCKFIMIHYYFIYYFLFPKILIIVHINFIKHTMWHFTQCGNYKLITKSSFIQTFECHPPCMSTVESPLEFVRIM